MSNIKEYLMNGEVIKIKFLIDSLAKEERYDLLVSTFNELSDVIREKNVKNLRIIIKILHSLLDGENQLIELIGKTLSQLVREGILTKDLNYVSS